MHLLNKKSEEIIRLEHLITSLSTDKHALQTSLEAQHHQIAFAEKNANVFREEYLRVSALVDELRRDKAVLEERVEVAEGQVREGVQAVKALFESRVERLEEEVVYHKCMTTFCVEQSRRTQDEEMRRRAAECVEVEGRCRVLEERVEGAREMMDRLERLVTQRDRENEVLRVEGRVKQEEIERLRVEGRVKEEEIERLKKEVEREMVERGVECKRVEEVDVVSPLRAEEEEEIESLEMLGVEESSRRETIEKEIEWKGLEEPNVVLGKETEEEIESLEVLVEEPSFLSSTMTEREIEWKGLGEPHVDVAHGEHKEHPSEEEASLSAEVYMCMWRKEGREKCNAMFLSIEVSGLVLATRLFF